MHLLVHKYIAPTYCKERKLEACWGKENAIVSNLTMYYSIERRAIKK
jgi:hypothetical protein